MPERPREDGGRSACRGRATPRRPRSAECRRRTQLLVFERARRRGAGLERLIVQGIQHCCVGDVLEDELAEPSILAAEEGFHYQLLLLFLLY